MKTPCRIVIDCENSLVDNVLSKFKQVFILSHLLGTI